MSDPVTLDQVYARIQERLVADPEQSYVARLTAEGVDAVLQKIGEEATEVILAAKNGEPEAAIHELADLWFHTLIWMAQAGITPVDIMAELGRRYRQAPEPAKQQ